MALNQSSWKCPSFSEPRRKVRFRCSNMDKLIGPAFRPGNIIEICGEAGSAKTQFCLDLALQTTAHSINGHIIYISTDRAFPTRRINQLLSHTDLSSDHLDRIIVKAVFDSAPFFEVLEKSIPEIASQIQIELIIIDSVVGAIRSEFEADKRDQRAQSVHKIGTLLHKLSRNLDIPVVVTNQVTAVIDQRQQNFGRNSLPCLGLTWSCYVHTRIYLTKTGMTVESDQLNVNKKLKIETSVRTADVDFCPLLPNIHLKFIVDNAGIRVITIKS